MTVKTEESNNRIVLGRPKGQKRRRTARQRAAAGADDVSSDEDYGEEQYATLFQGEELQWIRSQYDGAKYFMASYGLKLSNPGDCRQAQNIVQRFVRERRLV